MSRFVYRMQNILNIKEKLEEQARMDFGMAMVRLMEEEEKLSCLHDFMALQRIEIQRAEQKAEQERQKLQLSIQERKIQEKLRENAFEAFMREEKASESREIDELTSYTYGQKKMEAMAET